MCFEVHIKKDILTDAYYLGLDICIFLSSLWLLISNTPTLLVWERNNVFAVKLGADVCCSNEAETSRATASASCTLALAVKTTFSADR